MAHQLMDFYEWIRTVDLVPDVYYLEFDESGAVIGLHPNAGPELVNKIQIDDFTALEIHEGRRMLNHFRVDIPTQTIVEVEKIELNGLQKIDDILHRIIEKQWTKIDKPDVEVVYNSNENLLIFKINPLLKTTDWHGEQEMIFLVTDYNDPNALKKMIKFTVSEIISYPIRVDIALEDRFSVYTRRLFNNYTLEIL
jgi:hypothetical protein